MPYLVQGRLVEPCPLSAAEYFTLAVREWELVLGWMGRGTALGYGRLSGTGGGALLLDVESEGQARALARALPFAPYADITVTRVARGSRAGRDLLSLAPLGGKESA